VNRPPSALQNDRQYRPRTSRTSGHQYLFGVIKRPLIIFDNGFHRDRRGGTVPLAMLAVFLAAKIALAKFLSSARNP
jgi:hypothetical protein